MNSDRKFKNSNLRFHNDRYEGRVASFDHKLQATWTRYVGFGGYVRYFGGYSFVNDIVIGLSESPTVRDIKPLIKRAPGFILSCVYVWRVYINIGTRIRVCVYVVFNLESSFISSLTVRGVCSLRDRTPIG